MQDRLKSLLKSLVLLEATRFKREVGENPPRWQDKLLAYEKKGGYFVHFSDVPRMGLFIRNKWNTPIGFYAYFLNRDRVEPFGVGRPYMIVFKPKPEAKILDLQEYDERDYVRDTQKLLQAGFPESVVRAELPGGLWFKDGMPGRKLWAATRALSGANKLEPKDEDAPLPERGGGPTARWTMLFRRLGYDGVVDNGGGIIHPSEPSQAVFFNTAMLDLVEVIERPKRAGKDGDIASGQDLFSRNFSKRNLRGMDLSGKDLEQANFMGADLSDASLEGANLQWTNFETAKLYNASLKGTDLTRARLSSAKMEAASFEGANLSRARLMYSTADKANFRNANLEGADVEETSFEGADFRGANLTDCNISGAFLTGAVYDSKTQFPYLFDPERSGMVRAT